MYPVFRNGSSIVGMSFVRGTVNSSYGLPIISFAVYPSSLQKAEETSTNFRELSTTATYSGSMFGYGELFWVSAPGLTAQGTTPSSVERSCLALRMRGLRTTLHPYSLTTLRGNIRPASVNVNTRKSSLKAPLWALNGFILRFLGCLGYGVIPSLCIDESCGRFIVN